MIKDGKLQGERDRRHLASAGFRVLAARRDGGEPPGGQDGPRH